VAIALLALLAVIVVIAVAAPLVREPAVSDRIDPLDDAARERLRLREQRDDALAALKELEFDRRTGKISDTDYQPLETQLRAAAAQAISALDEPEPPPPASVDTAAKERSAP
jgi:hypothetical protein